MRKSFVLMLIILAASNIAAQEVNPMKERYYNVIEKKVNKTPSLYCKKIEIKRQPSDYIPFKDQSGKWGYKQYEDIVIIPKFSDAGLFSEGLAPVCYFGKYGFIDKTGKCVGMFKYDDASVYSEGLAMVKLGGKCGYIDRDGNQLIPYKYSDAGDFIDGLAEVVLYGKKGFIDKTGTWYNSRKEVMDSFTGFARNFIENYVNEWQRKGKFEKTLDWQRRVNEATRAVLVDSLMEVAKTEFIEYKAKDLESSYILGDYDADGEIFMVIDDHFGRMLVPVPIDQAMAFEENFPAIIRENKYYIKGDDIGLAEAVFTTPQGHSYKYSNAASLEFTQIDIDYDFESIEVEQVDYNVPIDQVQIKQKSVAVLAKSDVDENIPIADTVDANTFAVIIANEKYQRVAPVQFASNDGKMFKEYCNKTLGIPEINIRYVNDATLVNMWEQVDWLADIAKAYKGEAKLIFYYAGHGIPDESTKDAYLLPVDGNGANAATGYKLSSLYSRLAEYPTLSTVVLLDACFSGAQRNGDMMIAARGVVIKPREEAPKGNMLVFSAAQGDETAYPYAEKGHGLFTYFLLKKLQESGRDVTFGELADYISENVNRHSIIVNSKSQTPSVTSSGDFVSEWKNMTF